MTTGKTPASAKVVELVAEPCSMRVEHAEGPFWYDNRLGWVDGPGTLWTASVNGTQFTDSASYDVGCWLGSAVPKASGGWLVGAGTDIMEVATDGKVTPLTKGLGDPARVQMNDGKCDPAGRFWTGTMPTDYWNQGTEYAAASNPLYRFDGTAHRALEDVRWANGLAWSLDSRTMYYIDSAKYRVDAFDYDLDTGEISNRRTLCKIEGTSPSARYAPDGMSIDNEGHLWVAIYGSGTVRRYAPDGTLVAIVRVSTPNVTSCCFGGPEGNVLFITTSQLEMNPEQRDADPNGGRVFRVETDVSAPPATPYSGR